MLGMFVSVWGPFLRVRESNKRPRTPQITLEMSTFESRHITVCEDFSFFLSFVNNKAAKLLIECYYGSQGMLNWVGIMKNIIWRGSWPVYIWGQILLLWDRLGDIVLATSEMLMCIWGQWIFLTLCMTLYLSSLDFPGTLREVASQVVLVVKNPPANARDKKDAGSILGLGRAPGEGRGNPLQYSCLENAMDKSIELQRVRHDWSDLAHRHWGKLILCVEEWDGSISLNVLVTFWCNCISLSGRSEEGIQFNTNGKFQTWVQSHKANTPAMKISTSQWFTMACLYQQHSMRGSFVVNKNVDSLSEFILMGNYGRKSWGSGAVKEH